MRWCYKTVHFDLKKEGFLGSAFLDEAEVEQSLNEYGQSGWELVSIVETQDGLIAFFKQPLTPVTQKMTPHPVEEYEVLEEENVSKFISKQDVHRDRDENKRQNQEKNNDLNTIRIE